MTFWDHLDELRATLLRSGAAVLALTVAAFLCKDILFDIVLAPSSGSFITYRWLDRIAGAPGAPADVSLINTGLAGQFMIHVKTAMCAGVLLASPYILYQLFAFIAPGLFDDERRATLGAALPGFVMFMLGVAVSYFMVFPLTFRFLGSYQVSPGVTNMISLDSYMSALIMISLSLGVLFELPVVAVALARMGILGAGAMRRFRRHAIVVILIAAAVITPTSDIFTLLVVALPIWLLYEVSVILVDVTRRRSASGHSSPLCGGDT